MASRLRLWLPAICKVALRLTIQALGVTGYLGTTITFSDTWCTADLAMLSYRRWQCSRHGQTFRPMKVIDRTKAVTQHFLEKSFKKS